MPDPQLPDADAASLVISYLWSRRGQALIAELGLALASKVPPPQLAGALEGLVRDGWIDRLHQELPAVQFTPEAFDGLSAHAHSGAPLPERFVRKADRDAQIAAAQAGASVEMVQLMREMREEQKRTAIEMQRLRAQIAGPSAPRQIDVRPGP